MMAYYYFQYFPKNYSSEVHVIQHIIQLPQSIRSNGRIVEIFRFFPHKRWHFKSNVTMILNVFVYEYRKNNSMQYSVFQFRMSLITDLMRIPIENEQET